MLQIKDITKFRGGGVEETEDFKSALVREVLEETGCTLVIGKEVGRIVEYKNWMNTTQHSLCFIGKLTEIVSAPDFTKEEIENGFKLLWVPLDKAISLVEKSSPEDYEGKFIALRDSIFLKKAKELIATTNL